MSDYECAFCGHPDSMHRVVDAITGRIIAGEDRDEALADYGWDLSDFLEWSRWLARSVMGLTKLIERPSFVRALPDCEDIDEEASE